MVMLARRLALAMARVTQQSSAASGTAHNDGSRRHVRTGLWMPTISAMRFNPVIRALRDHLGTHHKASRVITIACLHKLLTILNTMLAKDEFWTPHLPMP